MKDKMHTCELYLTGDEEIMKEQTSCLEKLYDFNATHPLEGEKREQLLKEMFAEIGENCYIEPPFHSNWGGHHVHFVVVGAGSIVTKDLPDNVVAVGNPCKVLREVNEHDREYYFKDRRIDWREVCDTP